VLSVFTSGGISCFAFVREATVVAANWDVTVRGCLRPADLGVLLTVDAGDSGRVQA
jgi:hypothetical protein